jgi:hypothetical protein
MLLNSSLHRKTLPAEVYKGWQNENDLSAVCHQDWRSLRNFSHIAPEWRRSHGFCDEWKGKQWTSRLSDTENGSDDYFEVVVPELKNMV